METSVVDLESLYQLSGRDPKYIFEVISLFLEHVPKQLLKLEQLIMDSTTDWAAIRKLSHSMKSSVIFVKVSDMYDHLMKIESYAKEGKHIEEMREHLQLILTVFREAMPILIEEQARCKLLKK